MKRLFTLVFLFLALFVNAQTADEIRGINGLVAWFSADSVHLTADNHVDTLYDKSGNRLNVIQTSNDAQPTLSENALNENPAIVFDGNDYLNGGDICDLGPNGTSIFIVGKSNKKNGCFVAKSKAAGVPNRYAIYYENNICFIYNNSTLSKPLDFGDYKVLQAFLNPDSSAGSLVANGNQLGKANTNTVEMNSTFDFLIGGYNNGNGTIPPYSSLSLDGEIAEIFIFNRYLNHCDSLTVMNYLMDKYSARIAWKPFTVVYDSVSINAFNPQFVSYKWDDGSSDSVRTFHEAGLYSVTIVDTFGFTRTLKTRVVFGKRFSDTTICLGDTITWDPDLSGPYTYKWSDGSAGKELRIATEGKYWVTITDTAGHEWHSDTVYVTVDSISLSSVLDEQIEICSGEYVSARIKCADSYLWSNNSTENTIAITLPGKYWVQIADRYGCIVSDTTIAVVNGTAPSVSFTCDNVEAGQASVFTNNSSSNDDSELAYSWNFGDHTNSSDKNPSHLYEKVGTYNVTLTASTESGCSNSFSSSVFVKTNSSLLVDIVSPTPCQTFFENNIQFKWNNIDGCKYYNMQIASDSDFVNCIIDTNVYSNDTTIILSNGIYFWRIKSDVGLFDAPHQFSISSIKSIKGLVAWFSADSVHITVDNRIDTLYDKSENRRHAVQNTIEKQPICIEAEDFINGKPSLCFDGNDYFTSDFRETLSQPNTVFVLWESTSESNAYRMCFTGLANGLRNQLYTGNNQIGILAESELKCKFPSKFDFTIFQSVFNGANSKLFANGNLLVYGNAGDKSSMGITIGAFHNGLFGISGNIAELIFINDTLSSSDSTIIIGYLRDKYAPKVSLHGLSQDYGFKPVFVDCRQYPSFSWSDGCTDTVRAISISGFYKIDVTDHFGFHSSDSAYISLVEPHSLPDTTICQGDTITWNPDLSGPYYYKWSDGSTGNELRIATEGKYWVVITDTTGYEWHSDTIFVKVDRFSQQMTLGTDTINTCIGNNIYLQSGFDEATRYQWSDGTTADHLVVKSAGSYSVTASNLRGCIGHDTALINTMGTAPTVGFDNSSLCATRQIAFTDKSSSNDSGKITSYHWDFGDGGISSAMNPAHIYDTSGNFQISYTISCENGCSNILKKNIYVNALPKADFSTSQACSNAPTRFTSTSTTANGYLTSWQWNINDSTYGIQNPQATFTQYGRHTIELIVTANNGCTDTLHRDIDILQGPEVDFTYSAPCFDSPIYLTNNSKTILGLASSYTWKSDTAIFSTQKSPSITYKDTTTHQVTLTIKQIANGCISSLTKEIRVMPNPVPSILTGKICEGQDAILEGYNLEHASISKKWLWTIDSLQFTGEHRTSRTFGAKGKHKISLQITDSAGCVATFDTTVSVHETPTATFRPLSTRGPVPFQTEFTNTSANADSLLWIFGDGEESTDIDVCHTYHTDGIYNVQLIASNSFCSDTAQQVIEAIYPQIDIVLVSASAKTDNGQIAVSAVVANRSNYDIPNVSILWYDNVGHRISETIADTIKQGKIVQYEFVAKIGEARPDRIQYICVSAEPSTAYTDDTPSDNEYCIIFNKDEFSVCQPMPNPAKDKLAISYILPNDGNVRIELYNHNGGKIGNLYDSQASAGYNVHNFDVSTLNPGIYFYRITSGNESKTQMLIIER